MYSVGVQTSTVLSECLRSVVAALYWSSSVVVAIVFRASSIVLVVCSIVLSNGTIHVRLLPNPEVENNAFKVASNVQVHRSTVASSCFKLLQATEN